MESEEDGNALQDNIENNEERQNQNSFTEIATAKFPFRFMATVTSGFEYIAEVEVREKLNSSFVEAPKMQGRVYFDCENVNEDTIKILTSMKSFENLWALAGIVNTNITEKEKSSKEFEKDIKKITLDEWKNAFITWQTFRTNLFGIKNKEILNSPTFLTDFRTTLKLPKIEYQKLTSFYMSSLFPKWRRVSSNSELIVMMQFRNHRIYGGFSLTDQSISLNQVKNRSYGSTALRPSIAWALCKAAKIQPGELVIDPMCGSGMIPEIGYKGWPSARFIGADNYHGSVDISKANMKKSKSVFEVIQWDACKIPLFDSCCDVIICDLPFGIRVGSHKKNERLYPSLLNEFWRILKLDSGRCILLTSEKKLLLQVLSQEEIKGWNLVNYHGINMGGVDASVFFLLKQPKDFNTSAQNSNTSLPVIVPKQKRKREKTEKEELEPPQKQSKQE